MVPIELRWFLSYLCETGLEKARVRLKLSRGVVIRQVAAIILSRCSERGSLSSPERL